MRLKICKGQNVVRKEYSMDKIVVRKEYSIDKIVDSYKIILNGEKLLCISPPLVKHTIIFNYLMKYVNHFCYLFNATISMN